MRRTWVPGLALAALIAACGGESQTAIELPGARAASAALADALASRDAASLDTLLAEDFLWVRNSGATGDKRAFIAALTDPSLRLDPVALGDVSWIESPDAALVAGEATLTGFLNQQRVSDHHRFADYWVRRDGAWRLAYAQTTSLPED
jgi:ketosteroid isomerase-like protein